MFNFGRGKTYDESDRYCKSLGMTLPTSDLDIGAFVDEDRYYTACDETEDMASTVCVHGKTEQNCTANTSECSR